MLTPDVRSLIIDGETWAAQCLLGQVGLRRETWSLFGEWEVETRGVEPGPLRGRALLLAEFYPISWLYFCFNFSLHEESAIFILPGRKRTLT